MRLSGLAVPVAAAAVLVLGPQAGADPRQDPIGSMYGQACGYGAGVFGATPFAPVVGVACTPPQAVGALAQASPAQVMPAQAVPAQAAPAQAAPAQAAPAQAAPDQAAPDQAVPDEPMPDEPMPVDVMPEDVMPEEVVPAE